MAKLTPEQITKVSAWVAEGATLSQIQERLSSQLEVSMTYMDCLLYTSPSPRD